MIRCLEKVGRAAAVQTEAEGLTVATGLAAQQQAIGKDQTAIVNAIKALSGGGQRFMPDTLALTIGHENGSNGINALIPSLMKFLQNGSQNGSKVTLLPQPDAAAPLSAPVLQAEVKKSA